MGACCCGEPTSRDGKTTKNKGDSDANLITKYTGSTTDHCCSVLAANPKLRHRQSFRRHCHSLLKDSCAKKHQNKNADDADDDHHPMSEEAADFWNILLEKIDAGADPQNNNNNSMNDAKEDEEKEKENEPKDDDKKFDLAEFWADLTQIDDQILAFFDRKLEEFALSFAIELLSTLSEIVLDLQRIPIAAEEVYHLLRRLPVLGALLPKDTLRDDIHALQSQYKFHNWGLTQRSNPAQMAHLNTKAEVIAFVNEARAQKKKVRVTMFSHSWSPMFADDGSYFGKLLPAQFNGLHPQPMPLRFSEDLTEVRVDGYPLMYVRFDLQRHRVIVGGSATNLLYIKLVEKRFRAGLVDSIPSEFANVIQLHQSFIGTHAVSCHGAGVCTAPITEYVRRLNVINYMGEEVVYDTKEVLDKIGCHFGLLGIVVEMEVQFKPTYYCLYRPYLVDFKQYMPDTGDCPQLQSDTVDNYYNEYFWWPMTDQIYVNNFKVTADATGATLHPTPLEREKQVLFANLAQLLATVIPRTKSRAHGWAAKLFLQLISGVALTERLGVDQFAKPVKMHSANALHFRYGIQNFRVLDTEWLFPLPTLWVDSQDGQKKKKVPDMRAARDLFVAAQQLLAEWHARDVYPQIEPLEMRIVSADTNVAMSWAKGEADFICSIEVLTVAADDNVNKVFYEYCEELVNRWIDLVVGYMGGTLSEEAAVLACKPHWGKDWEHITIRGNDIYTHLRNAYREDIRTFNEIRAQADPGNMFMNQSFEKLFL